MAELQYLSSSPVSDGSIKLCCYKSKSLCPGSIPGPACVKCILTSRTGAVSPLYTPGGPAPFEVSVCIRCPVSTTAYMPGLCAYYTALHVFYTTGWFILLDTSNYSQCQTTVLEAPELEYQDFTLASDYVEVSSKMYHPVLYLTSAPGSFWLKREASGVKGLGFQFFWYQPMSWHQLSRTAPNFDFRRQFLAF